MVGEEFIEKEVILNVGKVFVYIEGYLIVSLMVIFFDEIFRDDYKIDWDYFEDGRSFLDVLDK